VFPMKYKISTLIILLLIPCSILIHKGFFSLLKNYSTVFQIKNINIKGAILVNNIPFNTYINSLKQYSLIDINLNELQYQLEQNKFIRNVIIKRDLPNTLWIYIIERTPIAHIKVSDKKYIVDKDGYILPTNQFTNIPNLDIEFGLAINNTQISDDFIIEILSSLASPNSHYIDSIKINKNRETSFKIKNLSSLFLINQRILTDKFINKALNIAEAIKENNIKIPKNIDIHSDENTSIGFFN